MTTTLRDLHSQDDFAAVVDVQRTIWGRDDQHLPAWVLAAGAERGALLVGAEAAGRLVGFVYSVPALKQGELLQWSHLLGVLPHHRGEGTGFRLKLAQRERTLAQGLDLVEWTFDPLMAINARLNVARLGAVVEEYVEDAYGSSASPLHRGAPTDRFIAAWRIATPHVQRRLEAGTLVARDASVAHAPTVLSTRLDGRWRVPDGPARLDDGSPRVLVEIPFGFAEMLGDAPEVAVSWRLRSREVFTTYFSRGYRVVDFFADAASGRAAYLLQRP